MFTPILSTLIIASEILESCSLTVWSVHKHGDVVSLEDLPAAPFQMYMLSRSWPQSVCQIHRDQHSHGCEIFKNVTDWSVHGLWPSNFTGADPSYCGGPEFQVQQLQPIIPQMLQMWPNVFADETAAEFWQHEWKRHGTCAMASGAFSSQLGFFKRVLQLHETMSLREVLHSAGINPSKHGVSVRSLAGAISDAVHVRFEMQCKYDAVLQIDLPMEIRICYSLNWKLVDCYDDGNESYRLLDCKDDTVVYLPIENTDV